MPFNYLFNNIYIPYSDINYSTYIKNSKFNVFFYLGTNAKNVKLFCCFSRKILLFFLNWSRPVPHNFMWVKLPSTVTSAHYIPQIHCGVWTGLHGWAIDQDRVRVRRTTDVRIMPSYAHTTIPLPSRAHIRS